jgi:hypothetical protein
MMGPGMEVVTFDGLTFLGRRWWFRIVDTGNRETLAQSEAYNSKAGRDDTADRFARAFGGRPLPGKRR